LFYEGYTIVCGQQKEVVSSSFPQFFSEKKYKMPTDDDNNNIALIGRGESVLDANGHAVGDNKQVDTQTTIKESDEENVEDAASKEQDEINRIEALEPSSGYGCQKIKLDNWDPENENQWNAVGKSIATRNLIASIPNLTCAFGVWLVWSGKKFFCTRIVDF
jgi:hypothetical protein